MTTALYILCIVLFCIYLVLACLWVVRSIFDFMDDRESKKRNAKWEEERQQLERDRAIRDTEYHTARMKELEQK